MQKKKNGLLNLSHTVASIQGKKCTNVVVLLLYLWVIPCVCVSPHLSIFLGVIEEKKQKRYQCAFSLR